MPPRAERARRLLAGRAVFVGVVVLAAIPFYFSLDASWRPLIVRLACAGLAAGGCLRALRELRRTAEADTASPFDVPRRVPPAPELDSRFLRLRDEVVFSARSRRYFEAVLWPQLCTLAGTELPRPPRRRIGRLGPSLGTLEDLVARVEKRT